MKFKIDKWSEMTQEEIATDILQQMCLHYYYVGCIVGITSITISSYVVNNWSDIYDFVKTKKKKFLKKKEEA